MPLQDLSMADILGLLRGTLTIMLPTPSNLPRTSQKWTLKDKCSTPMMMWYHYNIVPTDEMLDINRIQLESDWGLNKCTHLTVDDLMKLLTFLCTLIYFIFWGQGQCQHFWNSHGQSGFSNYMHEVLVQKATKCSKSITLLQDSDPTWHWENQLGISKTSVWQQKL